MSAENIFVCILLAIEAYYWFWWLPRNWRNNRECQELYFVVTGKNVKK